MASSRAAGVQGFLFILVQCGLGHQRFGSIDGHGYVGLAADLADDRHDALQFLLCIDLSREGASTFTADIEEVGPGIDHFQCVSHCVLGVQKLPAI